MNANELRIGNIVHSPLWGTDVIVDIDNIRYHDDFTPVKITGDKLIEFGFEKHNDSYRKKTLHGFKTETPSRITIKYTACQNWVVIKPANRTIYLHSIHQLQNLYFALTSIELKTPIESELVCD